MSDVRNSAYDVLTDVDMVLDDINSKAERQVEWRIGDLVNELHHANLDHTAADVNDKARWARDHIRKAVGEVRHELRNIYKDIAREAGNN